ncbi:hypothetical protein HDU67_009339 [Dinochytrium kinnereticum]|nr:hypothetical protein HDU67_009339 [Dinochytrium kinnereticum]
MTKPTRNDMRRGTNSGDSCVEAEEDDVIAVIAVGEGKSVELMPKSDSKMSMVSTTMVGDDNGRDEERGDMVLTGPGSAGFIGLISVG